MIKLPTNKSLHTLAASLESTNPNDPQIVVYSLWDFDSLLEMTLP